jgi:hypothetical protein
LNLGAAAGHLEKWVAIGAGAAAVESIKVKRKCQHITAAGALGDRNVQQRALTEDGDADFIFTCRTPISTSAMTSVAISSTLLPRMLEPESLRVV